MAQFAVNGPKTVWDMNKRRKKLGAAVAIMSALTLACVAPEEPPRPAERIEVEISPEQQAFVILPTGFDPDGEPVPLLVSLHSWSFGYEQRQEELEAEADRRGWIYLFPDFRGRNDRPEACGSERAQQDILDAVAWAKNAYPVDSERVYLTGSSGGGHMTLLMAARHPGVWAAASAFVPISDLAAWHEVHAESDYGAMLRACAGGAPGASPEVDAEYEARSPLTWLGRDDLPPLDIAAGIRDGHDGSVPIRHTLEAFNAAAEAIGASPVTEAEIEQISAGVAARLRSPKPGDVGRDPVWGRAYYLRRRAGDVRVTIFEGGHEGIPAAQADWLAQFP